MEFPFEIGTSEVDLSTLGLDIMSGWVEVSIGYDNPADDRQPVALAYELGLDGAELARLEFAPAASLASDVESRAMLTRLNLRHPAIAWPDDRTGSAGPIDFLFPEFHTFLDSAYYGADESQTPTDAELQAIAESSEGKSPGIVVAVVHELAEFLPNTIRSTEHEKEGVKLKLWVGRRRDSDQLAFFAVAMDRPAGVADDAARTLLQGMASGLLDREDIFVRLVGTRDALPTWGTRLELDFSEIRADLGEASEDEELLAARERSQEFVEQLLTRLIVGPGEVLRALLAGFRYVGPIRHTPPPDQLPPRFPDPSRWASGLAAWDILGDPAHQELLEEVSAWLWNEDRLNTGHQLIGRLVREIDGEFQEQMLRLEWEEEHPSPEMKSVLSELHCLPLRKRLYVRDVEKNVDLPPPSVGVGICQVIPVVTAVLADGAHMIQVEQPAIHLHPAQQAAMGDLLVVGALTGAGKVLLVETHSEHLILRLQRRIREHAKGQAKGAPAITADHVAVYHIAQQDGQTVVRPIDLDQYGDFVQPWPDDFFEIDFYERFGHAR